VVCSLPMFARYLLNTLLEQLVPQSRWVSIPVWERLQNCKNIPLSSCKKWHFCDQPKHNWYKITVRLRLSEIWSSEWREEVRQANTKLKQFQKFNGLIYGMFFLLITVLFTSSLNFHLKRKTWTIHQWLSYVREMVIKSPSSYPKQTTPKRKKCVSKIIKLNKIKNNNINRVPLSTYFDKLICFSARKCFIA